MVSASWSVAYGTGRILCLVVGSHTLIPGMLRSDLCRVAVNCVIWWFVVSLVSGFWSTAYSTSSLLCLVVGSHVCGVSRSWSVVLGTVV